MVIQRKKIGQLESCPTADLLGKDRLQWFDKHPPQAQAFESLVSGW